MMNLIDYFNRVVEQGRPLEISLVFDPNKSKEMADVKLIPQTNLSVTKLDMSWIPAYGGLTPQEVIDDIRNNLKTLLSDCTVQPYANTGGDDYEKSRVMVQEGIVTFLRKLDEAKMPYIETDICTLIFHDITFREQRDALNEVLKEHRLRCSLEKVDGKDGGDFGAIPVEGENKTWVNYEDVMTEMAFYVAATEASRKLSDEGLAAIQSQVGNLVLTIERADQATDENYALES